MTDTRKHRHGPLAAKLGAAALLVLLAQLFNDGSEPGAVLGVFVLAWLGVLALVRRDVVRAGAARIALLSGLGFALALIDDPNPLAFLASLIAVALAALLPRRRFDDAFAWAQRLVWHGLTAPLAPLGDLTRAARVRQRRGVAKGGVRAALAMLAIPIVGGALFLTLFAGANPLIGEAFAQVVLPDGWTVIWRGMFGLVVLLVVWPSLRPSRRATGAVRAIGPFVGTALDPGVATLLLSLVTFNAIFAVENVLDIAFLWSGAPLPGGVTMADYAHRGAYSLIVTAVLAGGFVLVALRPGSVGAASPMVRRLVTVWIAQTLLLVASSVLRTLDYVDAYGMTVLRLAALAWMGLVATGLVLIAWRLLRGRSAAWLINANALAAALVLSAASVIDLGASAAAWNTRVALEKGRAGPRLDLCYFGELGASAMVPLAVLETHARDGGVRDRLAYLRWRTQQRAVEKQANWRSWTWRAKRRLDRVEALVGGGASHLRPAPNGRACDGSLRPPPASPQLTGAPQR